MEGGSVNSYHVLVVPYPTQGHINPMLQFSKCLASRGVKATLAVTNFIFNSMQLPKKIGSVQIVTISDGHDEGGFAKAESIESYIKTMEHCGSKSLAEVIMQYKDSPTPVRCIIYDSFLPWAQDVAKKQYGLVGAAFFTQNSVVNYIYYHVHHGMLRLPLASTPIHIPGLPPLELQDMPSFIYVNGSYPAYFKLVLNQYSNIDKADWILVNTFYKLENEVVDAMSKLCPILTIGPTIPYMYLDNGMESDKDYGINLFESDSTTCTNWLNGKPAGSVIYIAFGSMVNFSAEQLKEFANGLKESGHYFIWIIGAIEQDKFPRRFIEEETTDKGVLVNWCPQLEVLSNESIGCFFTHCGWNSTIEALSLGVPIVAMPQWTDQTTDAKLVEDVWKIGVRVKVDESGIVTRQEIQSCIKEIMEGERGKEMRLNARKWRELAREAVSNSGTSDENINTFVTQLLKNC